VDKIRILLGSEPTVPFFNFPTVQNGRDRNLEIFGQEKIV
jgi:hypothetical protein